MLAPLIAGLLQLTAADLGLQQPSAALPSPKLVRRGQPVTLSVRSGSLSITTQGRALADGRAGDLVRVVTPSSRTVQGVVEADGAIRIAAAN